jgi:Na+-transporting NADH:ubiquinone oxidoreductase subunit C
VSESQAKVEPSSRYTLFFVVALSLFCALVLSLLASALAKPKEIAKELDRSKQMMIAAKILSPDGYFMVEDKEGRYQPARLESDGKLVADPAKVIADQKQLIQVYNQRLVPFLTNSKGEVKTFKDVGLNESDYESGYRKSGYYKQPWKLFYEIMPNGAAGEKVKPEGYVIPVNGYGLWDAIYGYLAIKPDGDTVIGISWYDQKETPGLGANIAEASWQNHFDGKKIFQESAGGSTDFKAAPLGITVVKGKVSEVLGDSPKAKSAVDGMTGATLTGNGVTDAYKAVLAAYRPFLIKLHNENGKEKAP